MSNVAEKLTTIAENQEKVYKAGKQAEWSDFWDNFQQNGNRADYGYGFGGTGWNDENFNPKYPMIVTGAYQMFIWCNITDLTREGIVLDFSKCNDMRNAFAYSKIAKYPTIDLSKANTYNTFGNSEVTDLPIIVQEKTDFSSMLVGTKSLVNLTISGTIGTATNLKDSSLLSAESVQGVIDCLKDLTGATARTLTLHADVGAKLTEEQKANITAKNWTLVF